MERVRGWNKIKKNKRSAESNCPRCNKRVNAIVIQQSFPVYIDNIKTYILLLGCPKCKVVFFDKE